MARKVDVDALSWRGNAAKVSYEPGADLVSLLSRAMIPEMHRLTFYRSCILCPGKWGVAGCVALSLAATQGVAQVATGETFLPSASQFEQGNQSISFPALAQMFRPEILGLFLFNCVVILGIASAIVFHPARIRTRRGVRDYELPRLFMVYGMIGMGIGFLVLQHGAVIGFVVFGIGGLLRFRSVLRNPTDTVEVILVTLLGLCVGLNLQNMAVLIGIASWIVIWFFGRKRTYQLGLKHTSSEGLAAAMASLEKMMPELGWELDRQMEFGEHSSSTNANAAATVVFRSKGSEDLSEVEAELSAHFQGKGIEWRLK